MQIREIALTELDLVYPLVQQEYAHLSSKQFEDLIYEMKKENYKILTTMDKENIIAYIGVRVQTSILLRKHLYVSEFITHPEKFQSDHLKEIQSFIKDFAKAHMCQQIEYSSSIENPFNQR